MLENHILVFRVTGEYIRWAGTNGCAGPDMENTNERLKTCAAAPSY